MHLRKLKQASFHHHSPSFPLQIKSTPLHHHTISFPMPTLKVLHVLTIFIAMISPSLQSQQPFMNSRKLDETPPNLENKCGSCPCNNPCNPQPSPPPPALPPPPPPPPPKKQPPSNNYCPPPPAGGQYPPNTPYIYINGPPGDLYPVDPYYSGSPGRFSSGLMSFLISSILWMIA